MARVCKVCGYWSVVQTRCPLGHGKLDVVKKKHMAIILIGCVLAAGAMFGGCTPAEYADLVRIGG